MLPSTNGRYRTMRAAMRGAGEGIRTRTGEGWRRGRTRVRKKETSGLSMRGSIGEGGYSAWIHPGIYGRPRGGVNAIKRASIRPSRRTSLISESSASLPPSLPPSFPRFLFLSLSPSLSSFLPPPMPPTPSSILSSSGSRSRGRRWVLLRDKRPENSVEMRMCLWIRRETRLMTLKAYGFIHV